MPTCSKARATAAATARMSGGLSRTLRDRSRTRVRQAPVRSTGPRTSNGIPLRPPADGAAAIRPGQGRVLQGTAVPPALGVRTEASRRSGGGRPQPRVGRYRVASGEYAGMPARGQPGVLREGVPEGSEAGSVHESAVLPSGHLRSSPTTPRPGHRPTPPRPLERRSLFSDLPDRPRRLAAHVCLFGADGPDRLLCSGCRDPSGRRHRAARSSTFSAHWFRLFPESSAASAALRCTSGLTRNIIRPE